MHTLPWNSVLITAGLIDDLPSSSYVEAEHLTIIIRQDRAFLHKLPVTEMWHLPLTFYEQVQGAAVFHSMQHP